MPAPTRPGPASDDGEPALGPAGMPRDPSGSGGLPPHDPGDVSPPRPVQGDPGHGGRRYGEGSGAPPGLGDDPDRLGSDAYDDTPAFPYGDGRGTGLDLGADPGPSGPDAPGDGRGSPPSLPPAGRPDPRLPAGPAPPEPSGEGGAEGERDGFEWLLGVAAVLVLLGLVALLLSSRSL